MVLCVLMEALRQQLENGSFGMVAWERELGDRSTGMGPRRSVGTGVLGCEYWDGIMGIGVWGQ